MFLCFYFLSMPQVIEQSLFLFIEKRSVTLVRLSRQDQVPLQVCVSSVTLGGHLAVWSGTL